MLGNLYLYRIIQVMRKTKAAENTAMNLMLLRLVFRGHQAAL